LYRLGLIERMRASAFVKKYSVQFVSPSGRASQPFYFFDRYDRETMAQTWQVYRSEFDQVLVDRARECGAEVREGVKVISLMEEDGRVVGVVAREGEGDEGAERDEGIDGGATTVAMIPEKGWFWYIPLHDNRVSVGVVAEGKYLTRDGVKDPAGIFELEKDVNPWIRDHLAAGRQVGRHYLTSEYSFHSRHCAKEGLLLVGDAFCFLDPVFSSGLMLALKSGVMAGDAVAAALGDGDFHPQRFAGYAEQLREGIENMRKLVYAFYDQGFSFKDLIERYPEVAGDVTDCLSGDVNKDFSRLWAAVREFAAIPESLPYGAPQTVSARREAVSA
jgi:flavin-dependent dehydrogenase